MATRFIVLIHSRDCGSDYVPCWTWECQRMKEQRKMVASHIIAKIIVTEKGTK